MARIPDSEIERLKNEVSVQRLVEASGIELKKTGKDYTGKCPFHEDDTASLVVTPVKNLWHCFGCGAAGGPIDWVMRKNGASFRHAVELLRDGVPSLAAGSGAVKRTTVRALEAPVQFDADDQALLNQVVGYYHETLKQSPEALAYLQARGLASTEAVEHFKLGYADRTLGLRLPQKNRVAGSDIRTRLQRIGIYRESGHEHFNGSLIVPVPDEHGNAVEVYGRKIRDDLRKGTPLHLYLPEACRAGSRGVFNAAALQASKEIILCEALIDALTFWCAGYRNVTSAYGIEGFTDDMLEAFKRHGTERVLIAFDRDEAGERGAAKVSELLMQAGIECYRIQFPKGMDANEYALKVTPASNSLGIVIRKAVWLGKGAAPAQPSSEPITTETVDEEKPAPNQPAPLADMPGVPTLVTEEKSAPLPASPMPASTPPDVPCVVTGTEILITLGERRYRVRGLAKNLSFESLKVNLLASSGERFYVDTLDLYSAKQRGSYLTQAAVELQMKEEILKADLGRVLLRLEQLQEEAINKTLQPAAPVAAQMSEPEREAALALLRAPDLVERILADFAACGLVGEETNKLVGYLAAVSRKLDRPLGVVIQSSSAAGKSSLMDAVLAFVPIEDKVKYSAMTGQSLFYMGETNLKHKALAIVEEEGASRASYALKLLQSEGELTIASTGKDPASGNLITQQYRVEGPVALMVTTTARDIDEELMNRCLVLSVDEGREQTRAIHQLQRDKRTLEGLIARRDKEALITLHQNAQRLLRPLDVLNPYAQFLTFPDQTTRLRRDHEKYLTLIDTLAFLHQHQREVKTAQRGQQAIEYIEVTLADIELANRIAHDVLGRSLDELPPQTRRLLKLIDGYVNEQCTAQSIKRTDFFFSRRALREAINWGDTQLKIHLARLAELEYLVTHRTKCNGFEYELVYDMADADNILRFPGLADIAALKYAYDVARSGQNTGRSGSGRPVVGGQPGGGRADESPAKPLSARVADDVPDTGSKTHLLSGNTKKPSYPQPVVSLAAAA
ncbi:MAG: DNA primase [Gallionellales bacterium RIFCSPHIGHO2_02_FULL_57_16]|nr:MAG: DNA primase [Gallionellales bacterium RIFCSPHIGHO2_02_FULL_57_16]